MPKYEFDKNSFSFKKAGRSVWSVALAALKLIAVTFTLAVVYYIVFSTFISTDTERKLRRENKMYEKIYPQMLEKEELMEDVITNLQIKDNEIYKEIFNTEAPSLGEEDEFAFTAGTDSVADAYIVKNTAERADALLERSRKIDKILGDLAKSDAAELPPLSFPLGSLSYAQVGASLGQRLNPFYKVPSTHWGLDLIAPQGDPVFATGDGIVSSVTLSRQGLGNQVEIAHDNGYVTRYCHLADVEVKKGQMVKKGRKLGYVGISGNSFAPHLHYEVLLNGEYQDPVNFFFASVSPEEYMKMMFMSANTGQTLD